MTIPSKRDLDNQRNRIESLGIKLSSGKLSEKEMCTIIRSSIRRAWFRSPVKLLKLETAKIPDMDVNTRTKWLIKCESCKDTFKLKDIECDHIKGEHKLLGLGDIESFARSILEVGVDDLQMICKVCHREKTYAERYGVSREEAKTELKLIAFLKVTKVGKQKTILEKSGYTGSDVSNATKRKDLLRLLIKEGKL